MNDFLSKILLDIGITMFLLYGIIVYVALHEHAREKVHRSEGSKK